MPILKFTVKKNIGFKKFCKLQGLDKTKVEKSLKQGGVLVNKKRIKNPEITLKKGDRVSICIDENPPQIEFSKKWIEYEDEWIIVLNKPQGITTQGTMCYDVNHLFYFVKQYLNGYAGLHHRLDRDTSGLVLFTKKREANKPIAELFKNKTIEKTYLAIIRGKLTEQIAVKQPIGRIPGSEPAKWWINMPQSKDAETIITPLEAIKDLTLVEAKPLTGRTHQIRIHLASIGKPILGDRFYNPEETSNFNLMLHCKKIVFNHPITKKKVKIETDTPKRFLKILEKGLTNE